MEKEILELEFYKYLSDEERALLEHSCYYAEYKAGALIYSPARDCIGMLLVKKGIIRAYLLSDEGKKATIYRFHENEICILSMSCILQSITFDVEIEAEEDCMLWIIPISIVEQLKKNIYVENFIYKITTEKFSCVVEAIQQLLFMTLEQRIIIFLLDEVNRKKTNMLEMTKGQIAENIQSAREAVSRVLTRLSREGVIAVSRGKIEILEKEKLYQRT